MLKALETLQRDRMYEPYVWWMDGKMYVRQADGTITEESDDAT